LIGSEPLGLVGDVGGFGLDMKSPLKV